MDIGVRELRDGLSRHLARVGEGHTITVTDHGKPVARIVPIGELTSLERLIAEGRITPGQRRKSRPKPVKTSGAVSDLVREQRR
ncbi:type II toxin-antitoxin system prevent-host-death family antitoxin [Ornithinimicrobium faecis]|uniref:Antitoxin n=2 Tax=Ornithinimicrobium faecis TaxID=2934158 RepID=A0ABY4YYF1_9MICO|nr:type II toxin-antitoxin system prevent-host-death family antitoxin [Ornithinimicrobium sp. HY1793]USQ81559.1 type II toxin-antitoxin system prevent-host-death family antitoxin [Ornithinimicrobium sp. HY1793]